MRCAYVVILLSCEHHEPIRLRQTSESRPKCQNRRDLDTKRRFGIFNEKSGQNTPHAAKTPSLCNMRVV